MVKTRAGKTYDSVVRVEAELSSLVRQSIAMEMRRVFDDDDEDDTDGWQLEEPDNSSPHTNGGGSLPSSGTTLLPSPPISEVGGPPSRVMMGPSSLVCHSGTTDNAGSAETARRKIRSERDVARDKLRGAAKKKKKRQERQTQDPRRYRPTAHAQSQKAQATVVHTATTAAESLRPSGPAWIGARTELESVPSELEELLRQGMQLLKWDGMSTHVLADKLGFIFGLLVGQPSDPEWKAAAEGLYEAFSEAKEQLDVNQVRVDRRGDFTTVAAGVSYGGGQQRPGTLRHEEPNRTVIDALLRNPHMVRMAGHARSAFATYFPDLYEEYAETLGSLYDHDPQLRPAFEGSPWPAVSINFPPNSFTQIHTDAGNKVNGMCPIFSLGSYDYTKGGHLVLPDLNLVIQFPPACLIFIPSASLRHGNISVRPWEGRASWTLYAAGGLFRWVAFGFKRKKDLTKAEVSAEEAGRATRWTEALKKFPHVDSLDRTGPP